MLKKSMLYRIAAAGPLLCTTALMAGCGSGGGLPADPSASITQSGIIATGASTGGRPPIIAVPTPAPTTSKPAAPVKPVPPPVKPVPPATTPVSPTTKPTPPATNPAPPATNSPTSAKRSFDPNYIAELQNGTASWAHFPVKVYFVRDSNYTAGRQAAATAGFDEWGSATSSVVSYQVVSDPKSANLTVNFDPTHSDSVTTCMIGGSTIMNATMRLGTEMPNQPQQSLPMADLQVIGAHEMGHALGIEGHSTQSADIMFWSHTVGNPNFLTQRDTNTMKTIYYSLFTTGRAEQPSASTGPIRFVTMD